MVVFAISGSLKIDLKEHIGACQVGVGRDHIPGGVNIQSKTEFEGIAVLKEWWE